MIHGNCGERADIWLPSVTDESSDSDVDERDESSFSFSSSSSSPVSKHKIRRRRRKSDAKVRVSGRKSSVIIARLKKASKWYIKARTCDPCRLLPRARNAKERLERQLRTTNEGDDTTQLEKELHKVELKLVRLERHARWKRLSNPHIKRLEELLSWGKLPKTVLSYLDYCKIYDSRGKATKTLTSRMFRTSQIPAS